MGSSPKIPLVYIAGPFRADTPLGVRRNVERARDLGLRVAECGGYPVIPHTMTAEFDRLLTDEFWLAGTLALLSRCDALVLIHDWERSRGACAEQAWAHEHGMPWLVDIDPTDPAGVRRHHLAAFIEDLITGELPLVLP